MLVDAQPSEPPIESRAQKFEELIENNTGSLGTGIGIITVGYPGAGKTEAAREFEQVLRQESTENVVNVDLNSFADVLESDLRGDKDFIDAVLNEVPSIKSAGCGVIDGAASFEEIERVANYYSDIFIIYIRSHHAARHARLISDAAEQGNDHEDKYQREGLRQRDTKAARLGLNDILEIEFFDYRIKNENEEIAEFQDYCRYVGRDLYQDWVYR